MRETEDGKNVMGNLSYVPLDYNIPVLGKLYMDLIITGTYAELSISLVPNVNKALVMLFVDISVWLYTA